MCATFDLNNTINSVHERLENLTQYNSRDLFERGLHVRYNILQILRCLFLQIFHSELWHEMGPKAFKVCWMLRATLQIYVGLMRPNPRLISSWINSLKVGNRWNFRAPYHHHHHSITDCLNCNGDVTLCLGMNNDSKIVKLFLSGLHNTLEEWSFTSKVAGISPALPN